MAKSTRSLKVSDPIYQTKRKKNGKDKDVLKKSYFLKRDFVLDLLDLLLDEFQRGFCYMLLTLSRPRGSPLTSKIVWR